MGNYVAKLQTIELAVGDAFMQPPQRKNLSQMRIAAAQMQELPACCKLPHLHPPLIVSHVAKLQTFELIEGTAVTQPAQCKNLSRVRAAATLMQEPPACCKLPHLHPPLIVSHVAKLQTFELIEGTAVTQPAQCKNPSWVRAAATLMQEPLAC